MADNFTLVGIISPSTTNMDTLLQRSPSRIVPHEMRFTLHEKSSIGQILDEPGGMLRVSRFLAGYNPVSLVAHLPHQFSQPE